jgi:hypothetical protein
MMKKEGKRIGHMKAKSIQKKGEREKDSPYPRKK